MSFYLSNNNLCCRNESIDEAEPDEAVQAITKLGFSQFRSAAQHCLVKEVLQCQHSVAGVLPTGAGKTLAIFVALTEESGITIVVYPLRSVYDDAVLRLRTLSQAHPEFRKWTTWDSVLPLQAIFDNTRLLLVTAEQARNKLFLAQVSGNHSLVRRVVFDEAPLFITSQFRYGLSSLPILFRSVLSCPFVLLTATLQVQHEDRLRDLFFCPGLVIIRGPTVRPEIEHKVVRLPGREVSVQQVVEYINFNNNELTIVFVQSMDDLKRYSQSLESLSETRGRIVCYHGSLNGSERKTAANSWSSGRTPILIATTAFAYGIHDAKCHRIIHVGGSYDLDTYAQAVGRSGRDGRDAQSIVLLAQRSPTHVETDFHTFVDMKSCRLAALSSFMDSEDLGWSGSCGRCDWCRERRLPSNEVSIQWLQESLSVKRPTEAIAPFQERTQASLIVAQVKRNTRRLVKLCKESFCFTCFALSRGRERSNHTLSSCPHWRLRCFRCGATGCKRSDCSRQALVAQKLTECNRCVSCALPPFVFDVSIHDGMFSMGKHCQLKDTILPTMLLMWHRSETKAAISVFAGREINGFEDYLSWALDSREGLRGFLHFLNDYCAK